MEGLSLSSPGDNSNVKGSELPHKLISLKSCSIAHWELVLSSSREHHTDPNTRAPGAELFFISSGWSSIPSSGNSSFSLPGHSQPQSSGLTTEAFCPGYKFRHGIKCSSKHPRVRETRLQTQHSSKERTCNADAMNPATFLSAGANLAHLDTRAHGYPKPLPFLYPCFPSASFTKILTSPPAVFLSSSASSLFKKSSGEGLNPFC